MIAIDFGTGNALVVFGPRGPIEKSSLQLARVKGGKTPRDEFRLLLERLLQDDDVVVESPTVGSSGCEPDDVIEIVSASPNRLYTLSARAVKNYRMDYKIPTPKAYGKYEVKSDSTQEEAHILDAEILYKIATECPERLRSWHVADPCLRTFSSVRPHDKRGYRDEESDAFMQNLPPFASLPADLQKTFGKKGSYNRSLAMPFAMAFMEPVIDDGPPEKARRRFEKLIGLYDHGYPSFYRRATVTLMQKIAADMLGLDRYSREKVSAEQRKAAWRATQKQIRKLFHLRIGNL